MMMQAILDIFGPYEPIIMTLPDGSVIMGVDWAYISAVVIFSIFLFSLFKLVGVLFKR